MTVNNSFANPITFQHYRELPAEMFDEARPQPSTAPSLIALNGAYLAELGIDDSWFNSDEGLSILAGNSVNEDNKPIAMAYSGHQFGGWSALLGDGRAHMLGQLATADGSLLDVQLKGSGATRFSRRGDGRAALGSVLREHLVSEAMAALGIPTTRSLAVIATGEDVYRQKLSPGAILVRSASSHLRVGSFQYAYANLGEAGVKALADFTIAKHFPDLAPLPDKYVQLLDAIVARQASLIAQWMLVGFIHGVMNTDNMSIVGETIDYGPCAFMDEFKADKVFSSIDQQGRYAWDQQPGIALWDLTRLAETLLPLMRASLIDFSPQQGSPNAEEDLNVAEKDAQEKAVAIATQSLDKFEAQFQQHFKNGLLRKLGIVAQTDLVAEFVNETLAILSEDGIDFTVFFDCLTRVCGGEADDCLLALFVSADKGASWLAQWRQFKPQGDTAFASMRAANPRVIARNHRIEEAIVAAEDRGDFEPFHRLCRALASPYVVADEDMDLLTPPQPEQRVLRTFCGT